MNADDNMPTQIQHLLDELCVDLGICLTPVVHARLRTGSPLEVEAFVDAVLNAEGLDTRLHRQLRRQVKERVSRAPAPEGSAAPGGAVGPGQGGSRLSAIVSSYHVDE
jgi:hypothetical protein